MTSIISYLLCNCLISRLIMNNSETYNHNATLSYTFLPISPSFIFLLTLLSSIMIIIGIPGNFVVLLYKYKEMKRKISQFQIALHKSVNSYLVVNLSLSDILTASVSLPLYIISINSDVLLQTWSCKIMRCINSFLATININMILLISLNQYFIVFWKSKCLSKTCIRKIVYLCWLESVLISSTLLYMADPVKIIVNDNEYTITCRISYNSINTKIVFVFGITIQYLIPLTLVIYTSFKMWFYVKKKTRKTRLSVIIKQQLQTIKFISNFSLGLIFPYLFILFLSAIHMFRLITKFQITFVIGNISELLAFSNCIINPVIYYVGSKNFRKVLKKAFSFSSRTNHVGVFPKPLIQIQR